MSIDFMVAARALARIGVVLFALYAGAAGAAESVWSPPEEYGRVRLVSGGAAASGRLDLGLEFDLAPDWHIYWRTPGDAGLPPRIDWTGSENIGDPRIEWPAPMRFEAFGLQNYGYEGAVILPLVGAMADPAQPVKARAHVAFLVCAEICIPAEASLALDLPPGGGGMTLTAHARSLSAARASTPGIGVSGGMRPEYARIAQRGEGLEIDVRISSSLPLNAPDLFVEGIDSLSFSVPETVVSADGGAAQLRVVGLGKIPEKLPDDLILTVVDGARGVAFTVDTQTGFGDRDSVEPIALGGTGPDGGTPTGDAPGDLGSGGANLAAMLFTAMLGGLILNLMPCVLPVLSLKLLSVVGYGGGATYAVRLGFLASAAGVLFSFLLLAAGAIALKTAGGAVGWGIQFQQPLFLVGMAVVLVLFAANLWGLFEITLPGPLAALAGGGPSHGLAGHFAAGAFATLLATPCSAPFVGTAVGFALSRGPVEILAIFAALGIGLAAPYLAVAAFPQVATALPRPGPWMVWLKRGLALALGGTAVWLIAVMAAQIPLIGVLSAAIAMATILALLRLRGWPDRPAPAPRRRLADVGTLAAIAAAFAAPLLFGGGGATQDDAGAAKRDLAWERFDRASIDRFVADGRVVFVDVTADWCITCQVNKVAVLDADEVAKSFADAAVVPMRADWTRPDKRIAQFLAANGRYGIPFNIVYGPNMPAGLVLPELLNRDAVEEALRQAGG